MTFKTTLLAGTVLGVATLASGTALAQTPAGQTASQQAQIEALNRQIQALQSQMTSLKESLQKDISAVGKKVSDAPTVSVEGGRPRFRTADKAFDMAIRMRVHADYGAWFPEEDQGIPDLTDGFNIRRAFFGINGTVYNDWAVELTFNAAPNRGNGIELQAANVSYRGIKGWTFDFGVMQPKFTLDDSTSSNDIPFMERAPAANYIVNIGASDGRTAIGVTNRGDRHIVAAYVTGNRIGTGTGDDQVNILGRAAYRVIDTNMGGMGIGASGVYQVQPEAGTTSAGGTAIRFDDRPGARIGSSTQRLTRSANITNIDSAYGYGVDVGGNYRNLWAAGEYTVFGANTKERVPGTNAVNPFNDPEFDAFYVSAGYVLTGERRNYTVGEFAGVKPAWPFTPTGGIGAWEVAVRYSQADLVDASAGAGSSGSAFDRPGKETLWTFGLNWYPNAAIRFMLNYIMAESDKPTGKDVEADILAARLQFQF